MGKIIIREFASGHSYMSKKHKQCAVLVGTIKNKYIIRVLIDGKSVEDTVPSSDLGKECKTK